MGAVARRVCSLLQRVRALLLYCNPRGRVWLLPGTHYHKAMTVPGLDTCVTAVGSCARFGVEGVSLPHLSHSVVACCCGCVGAEVTPVFAALAPSRGTTGFVLGVEGTLSSGRHGAPGLVTIRVGDATCSLFDDVGNYLSTSAATVLPLAVDSALACVVPPLVAGVYNITVAVNGVGVAMLSQNGSVAQSDTSQQLHHYEQVAVVKGINPAVVSAGGGATLVITGSGFSSAPEDVTVTLGGFPCALTFASPSELQCIVPDSSTLNLDFATVCPARESGDVSYTPGAGLGSVIAGARGVRLQAWVDTGAPANQSAGEPDQFIPLER